MEGWFASARSSLAHKSPLRSGTVSLEQQLERVGFGRFQVLTLAAFILIIMADGMELVVTNIIWPQLPVHAWGLEQHTSARGLLVSLAFCGFVAGSIGSGVMGDRYGRRPIIFIHAGLFIPMSLLSAAADSLLQLAVCRFFVGMSMGVVFPVLISLMAEFTPNAWRAISIIAIPGIAYSSGQALVILAGIGLLRNSETLTPVGVHSVALCKDAAYEEDLQLCAWWRWMLLVGVIPDLIALVMVYFVVPESPRYLLYHGKIVELADTLVHIARLNGTEDKLADGGSTLPIADDRPLNSGLSSAFSKELLQQPLSGLLSIVVGVWVALSAVVFGGSFLFPIYLEQYVDMSREQGYWLMIALSLIEIPGVIVCFFILDNPNVGRRRLMQLLTLGSAFAALLLAVIWRMGPVALFGGNILMRSLGVLPYEIMYVYAAEIMPTSHRNTGLAIGSGASKCVGGIIPLILLPLVTPSIPKNSLFADSKHGSVGSSSGGESRKGGGSRKESLSLLLLQMEQKLANETELSTANATDGVADAEPIDGGPEGDADISGMQSEVWGDSDGGNISLPYLILSVCAFIATAILYNSPDPSTSLCDTPTETRIVLETARLR